MASELKRATVYIEPELHKAIRLKSVETNQSISHLVNDALRIALSEDEEDIAAFDERSAERSVSYEEFLAKLKADGKI